MRSTGASSGFMTVICRSMMTAIVKAALLGILLATGEGKYSRNVICEWTFRTMDISHD